MIERLKTLAGQKKRGETIFGDEHLSLVIMLHNCINLFTRFMLNFVYRLNLKLFKPMVLEQGQRFTLRTGLYTLGTGVVTKILTPLTEVDRGLLMEGKKAREKRTKKVATAE